LDRVLRHNAEVTGLGRNRSNDMALIVQAIVINDETGEVEKTYVETVGSRTHSWEAAQLLRRFLARMFEIVYPGSDAW
jgi:hypothetical protein